MTIERYNMSIIINQTQWLPKHQAICVNWAIFVDILAYLMNAGVNWAWRMESIV